MRRDALVLSTALIAASALSLGAARAQDRYGPQGQAGLTPVSYGSDQPLLSWPGKRPAPTDEAAPQPQPAPSAAPTPPASLYTPPPAPAPPPARACAAPRAACAPAAAGRAGRSASGTRQRLRPAPGAQAAPPKAAGGDRQPGH